MIVGPQIDEVGGDLPLPELAALDTNRLRAICELWRRQQREVLVRFDGVSMLPSIEPGEEILLVCSGTRPRIGDVVILALRHQIMVHRVVCLSRNGAWLITRGDAFRLPDRPMPSSSMLGYVFRPDRAPIHDPRGDRKSPMLSALNVLLNASSGLAAGAIHAATMALRIAVSLRDGLRN